MNTVQLFCKLSVSLKFLQNKNLTKSSLGFHQPINKRMVSMQSLYTLKRKWSLVIKNLNDLNN